MMFYKLKLIFLSVLIFFTIINKINTEVVCSEDELVREIIEDLEDNGKLDCLRESKPTPDETPEKRTKRIVNSPVL